MVSTHVSLFLETSTAMVPTNKMKIVVAIVILVMVSCEADILSGQSTTTESPLSPQEFLDILQHGMNMSSYVMTLDEIVDTIDLLPTIDLENVTLILQYLNINMSIQQLAETLVPLYNLASWGKTVVPDGNLTDLFTTMSTMNDQTLMLVLDNFNIVGFDPVQLGGALSFLQYLHNSTLSPDGSVPVTTPISDDLLNMISSTTTASPLSPQEFLDILQQGMNMSSYVMTLEETLDTIDLLPTIDLQKVTLILQDLNINMSIQQLAETLISLYNLASWGKSVVPNGNLTDLFNTMSTMNDQTLMLVLDNFNIVGLDPFKLGGALSFLQYIQNSTSSPDGSVPGTTPISGDLLNVSSTTTASSPSPLPNLDDLLNISLTTTASSPSPLTNLDDLLNMISTMDEQSLNQLLQNMGLNIDPSQLGGTLIFLQKLHIALSKVNPLLSNVDLNDLLNMMAAMDDTSLNFLLKSLNLDSITVSQIGSALTVLKTLQSAQGVISDGNTILPNSSLDDLLTIISMMDEKSLKLLLQSLNIDANVYTSNLGEVLFILQTLQSAISKGNPLLQTVDLEDLLKMMTTMDTQSLTLLLQNLNINTLDISELGSAFGLFQTMKNSLSNRTVQSYNGTDVKLFDYLDLGLLSGRCRSAMRSLVAGMVRQKPWAVQMIDAWGKPQSGILNGNMRWLGSYDQCLAVQPEVNGNTPFETNYCVSGNQSTFLMGVCVPKSCTESDIKRITSSAFRIIPLSLPLAVDYIQCKTETEHDTKAIVAIFVCSSFLALMVFATLYDVIILCPRQRKQAKQTVEATENDVGKKEVCTPGLSTMENGLKDEICKNKNDQSEISFLKIEDNSSRNANGASATNEIEGEVSENMNELSEVSTSGNGTGRHFVEMKFNTKTGQMETNATSSARMFKPNEYTTESKTTPASQGLCENLIMSFSVWTNGKKLLDTEQTAGTLGAINGIRFFTMSWVILTYSFTNLVDHNMFVDQMSGVSNLLQRRSFMAVSNSNVSMDTFFAMSGLLVSYVFMKEMKREKGRINWFMFYFQRFWRLTPPYMLVMMMDIALFRYVSDGPTWDPDGIESDFCKDTWWTNLLYINNFVKVGKNCFSWSWYLANDMQFYVLSPLLLVPFYFSKKIGSLVTSLLLVGVIVASGYISFHYELPTKQYSTEIISNTEDYYQLYYVKPYCRMGPYIVGIVVGYILYRLKGKPKLYPIANLMIWAVLSALACAVLYATIEESSGNVITAIYNAVHRIVWGVCVCWVVFACATGNGGFVNTLLSWRPFVPLRRLTYCAYLVHPLITTAYYRSRRQQIYTLDYNLIYLFIGHLVISYMVACVIFLAFQAPLVGLERALINRWKQKNKQ